MGSCYLVEADQVTWNLIFLYVFIPDQTSGVPCMAYMKVDKLPYVHVPYMGLGRGQGGHLSEAAAKHGGRRLTGQHLAKGSGKNLV